MADLEAHTPLLRRLPHSVDAEMALLGAVLVDNRAYAGIPGFLKPEHFVLNEHRAVYRAIQDKMAAGHIADPITLRDVLDGAMPENGTPYLIKLADCAATPRVARDYAWHIFDCAQRRELIAIGEDIINGAYQGSDFGYQRIAAIGKSYLDQMVANAPCEQTEILDMKAIAAADFPKVGHLVAGLIPSVGLTLLTAKPKVGKSWMLLDIALACAGGGCALGDLHCQQAEGLYLMLEDSFPRLKERINTVTCGGTAPAGAKAMCAFPSGAQGISKLEAYLDNNPACKVVGIDVLARSA